MGVRHVTGGEGGRWGAFGKAGNVAPGTSFGTGGVRETWCRWA